MPRHGCRNGELWLDRRLRLQPPLLQADPQVLSSINIERARGPHGVGKVQEALLLHCSKIFGRRVGLQDLYLLGEGLGIVINEGDGIRLECRHFLPADPYPRIVDIVGCILSTRSIDDGLRSALISASEDGVLG